MDEFHPLNGVNVDLLRNCLSRIKYLIGVHQPVFFLSYWKCINGTSNSSVYIAPHVKCTRFLSVMLIAGVAKARGSAAYHAVGGGRGVLDVSCGFYGCG